jgi:hypothetical protein
MKSCVVSAAAAAFLFLAHCRPSDGCAPLSTRCDGNVAQLCDANGSWQDSVDCSTVTSDDGAAFTCQFVSTPTPDGEVTGHTCVRAPTPALAGGAP